MKKEPPLTARLKAPKRPPAAAMLGGGVHIDGGGHPGEFAGDGDDAFARVEMDLEHRHGGTDDFVLHEAVLLPAMRRSAESRRLSADGRMDDSVCGIDEAVRQVRNALRAE